MSIYAILVYDNTTSLQKKNEESGNETSLSNLPLFTYLSKDHADCNVRKQ